MLQMYTLLQHSSVISLVTAINQLWSVNLHLLCATRGSAACSQHRCPTSQLLRISGEALRQHALSTAGTAALQYSISLYEIYKLGYCITP
jgi:hypothetical protein